MIDKMIVWLDAPKVVGFIFAVVTAMYLLMITRKRHAEFWEAVRGEDGKTQFIEMVLVVWVILFTAMIIADFAFGLVASDKAWWSMDSIFLIGIGGRVATVINRGNKS